VIYFIRSGDSGPIKIGLSNDVRQRARDLQTAHGVQLQVLGVMEGGRAEEKALHQQFAHARGVGEWFWPTPELLELIQSKAAPLPPPAEPPKHFEVEVRQTFHRLIRESGWTADEIARAAGSTKRAAMMWLDGKTLPQLPHAIALARQIPSLKAQFVAWMEPARDASPATRRVLATNLPSGLAGLGRKLRPAFFQG